MYTLVKFDFFMGGINSNYPRYTYIKTIWYFKFVSKNTPFLSFYYYSSYCIVNNNYTNNTKKGLFLNRRNCKIAIMIILLSICLFWTLAPFFKLWSWYSLGNFIYSIYCLFDIFQIRRSKAQNGFQK